MEINGKQVIAFITDQGDVPYENWLNSLKDPVMRQRILTRVKRLRSGNFGDCTTVGQGVKELRLFFGPGYRVYYGEDGDILVVLLCGGDKKSQGKDITLAQQYWQEYQQWKENSQQ
jgi:putative addiction module killer protein